MDVRSVEVVTVLSLEQFWKLVGPIVATLRRVIVSNLFNH